ncbi:MAG TPA: DNA polymerase I, partial [Candidatus Paceibacterota bacterium]|nr:DNA polymerase I [Candidatus Paceibacterota bacterium]
MPNNMEDINQLQAPILLLIDSYALLHRAYHAIPPLTSPKGEPTNAIYGFFRILFKVVHHFEPVYLVPAFDLPGPTFRHEKYSDYKAKRVKQEADFYIQIDKVKDILQKAGIKYFEKAGFEADDIIGTVSRLASEANKDLRVIIVTGDLDTLQLVDEHISVYTFHQGIKNEILYDAEKIKERFNLTPSQLIDYKSLRGDPS